MLVPRLGMISSCLCRISRPSYVVIKKNYAREITEELKKKEDEEDDDRPIPLSTSPASKWLAKWNREPPPPEYVWYTPYVIWTSLITFMLYFCVLREENDIDEMMYKPLPQTIEGLDKLFPHIDFDRKPEFVVYHEQQKLQKAQEQKSR
ncbi:uncharacterized protein LOC106644500 [Copidosoma floridanum]|uniref:uncharacterized protein LOC106644500 n=1 Tax=Copidosoma floridanum TaxID=29053 RepID=UPI0006C947BB|nr:uncharacterized protein LOC106644500 [Copidosoma floridanum]